jgi:hypothetical protein
MQLTAQAIEGAFEFRGVDGQPLGQIGVSAFTGLLAWLATCASACGINGLDGL